MNETRPVTGPTPLKVLIADDTAAIRNSMSGLLSPISGVKVVGLAQTGLQAVEMVRSLKPDILTLDIRMPEMNGIGVLETLKREGLTPLVLVLTGLQEAAYKQKCLSLGARYFLHKSTEFEKVVELLKELAAGRGFHTEPIMRAA